MINAGRFFVDIVRDLNTSGKRTVKVILALIIPILLTACGSQPAQETYSVPKGDSSQHCYITQSPSYIWLEQEAEWLALPAQSRQQFEQTKVNWLEENILIVSHGQKPSAGYSIELSNWLLEQDHWQVTRISHQPAVGKMQAQMMISPCLLVKIPKTIKSFTLNDEQGKMLGRWPY